MTSPAKLSDPMPNLPASKTDRTRTAILEAAYDLFVQTGYHGTSMRQIARRAGTGLSSIYNHFDGKEAIFAAVLDTFHPYRQMLQALDEAQGDTVEALVRDAGRRVRRIVSGATFQLLPLMFIEIVEFQGCHAKQLAEAQMPRLTDFAARLARQRGQLRSLSHMAMMRAFIGLMFSAKFTETFLKEMPGIPAASAGWYDDVLDIYLHGILADAPAPEA